ncbi:hypothetical protein KY284_004990 [Solanum tuberosum]|nr:hypothetical protein KY284_004990 [Solanum tuberosum]
MGLNRCIPCCYSAKEGLWLNVFMFIITIMFLKDTKTPISAPPDFESNKARRIVHRIISLDDLKFVKNAMNVGSYNQLLVDIVVKLLVEKTREQQREAIIFPMEFDFGLDLANMMENGSKGKRGWGNWFGYALLPFKIALRDNPLNYVKEAKVTVDRKKRSFEALSTLIVAEILIKFFGIKALMINFQSYINKMIIVVSVDENAIPDPHQLLDDFDRVEEICYG